MKYIFIDTNLYRSLFTNEEMKSKVLSVLEKISKNGYTVLLPQQVIDEINRNRYSTSGWNEGNNTAKTKELKSIKTQLENALKSFPELTYAKKTIGQTEKKMKGIEKELISNKKKMSSSRGNKVLKTIVSIAKVIPDYPDLAQLVQLRAIKGNPPFDSDQNGKNCDRYIWESIIKYFIESSVKKPSLQIFSDNNNDWCVDGAGEKKYLIHPFLKKEFAEKTKGGVVDCYTDLQQLPDMSVKEKEEIKKIETDTKEQNILENINQNVAEKLRTSNSWGNTDKIIRAILPYIDQFPVSTISRILKASIENSEYSFGPYNQVTDASEARNLFPKLYSRSKTIDFPMAEWKQFYISLDEGQQELYYPLRKDLEKSGIKFELSELKFIHPDDIPF